MRSRRLSFVIPILFGLAALTAFSCRSTTDLVLNDPAFREDMVRDAIAGERFRINPDDYPEIRRLFSEDSPDYRRAGAILAGQAGDPMFYPLVVAAATDDDDAVAEAARDVIAGSAEAYRPFLVDLLKEENPDLRSAAIRILAEIGGADLVPLLIGSFSDPDPGVANQASLAVRKLADRENPFLRDALESTDPPTRALAIRTLGRYADPRDMELFVESFSAADPGVRRESQLAALKQGAAGLAVLHEVAMDTNRTYRSRLSALEVIQGLRSPESLETLMVLLVDPDDRIGRKAKSVLGTYGAEAVGALQELYKRSSQDFRLQAVRLLGEIAAPSGLFVIAEALDDPSPVVRDAAYEALRRLGPDAWPALRSRLGSGGPASVQAALALLAEGADPWLVSADGSTPNLTVLFLLVSSMDRPELESYLERSGTSSLRAETILSLKDARDVGTDFAELDRQIALGADPYLYAWRQRELAAVASRDALRRSFDRLHDYYDSRDEAALADARVIRAESRRLESEARVWKERIDAMDAGTKERGEARLQRYRETRDFLVRTWEYVIPELIPLAEAVYADRGLDPRTLSRESALLE